MRRQRRTLGSPQRWWSEGHPLEWSGGCTQDCVRQRCLATWAAFSWSAPAVNIAWAIRRLHLAVAPRTWWSRSGALQLDRLLRAWRCQRHH